MILPVLCLRWCLRNFRSKNLICVLWGLVGLRLIPSVQTIPTDIIYAPAPAIDTGLSMLNQIVTPTLSSSFSPAPIASANPLQILPHAGRSFCPLAFGEIGVKSRIRALLQDKNPSHLLVVVATSVIVILAACFLTHYNATRPMICCVPKITSHC